MDVGLEHMPRGASAKVLTALRFGHGRRDEWVDDMARPLCCGDQCTILIGIARRKFEEKIEHDVSGARLAHPLDQLSMDAAIPRPATQAVCSCGLIIVVDGDDRIRHATGRVCSNGNGGPEEESQVDGPQFGSLQYAGYPGLEKDGAGDAQHPA